MKAAVVHAAGQNPAYAEFPAPSALPGQHLITVTASALSRLTRARASGRHYSAGGTFPFVAGVDGVGRLGDGQRVYFAFPEAPQGAMAEQVAVAAAQCIALPDALDDVTAAALVNPGMSSWMALRERAGFRAGESVLINGATGSSGQLAVQIARHLGARHITVTGRNPQMLDQLRDWGADRVIALTADEATQRAGFEAAFAEGVDVVLDYLWGPSARLILAASARIEDPARPLRFVQIGSMTGEEIALPASWLRARANVLMGSGLGSVALPRIMAAIGELLQAAPTARLRIETETASLHDVATAWDRDTGNRRLVFLT